MLGDTAAYALVKRYANETYTAYEVAFDPLTLAVSSYAVRPGAPNLNLRFALTGGGVHASGFSTGWVGTHDTQVSPDRWAGWINGGPVLAVAGAVSVAASGWARPAGSAFADGAARCRCEPDPWFGPLRYNAVFDVTLAGFLPEHRLAFELAASQWTSLMTQAQTGSEWPLHLRVYDGTLYVGDRIVAVQQLADTYFDNLPGVGGASVRGQAERWLAWPGAPPPPFVVFRGSYLGSASQQALKTLFAHELGHIAGLGHVPSTSACATSTVMMWYSTLTSPGPSDTCAVRRLYQRSVP